jgi:hypothetical protein
VILRFSFLTLLHRLHTPGPCDLQHQPGENFPQRVQTLPRPALQIVDAVQHHRQNHHRLEVLQHGLEQQPHVGQERVPGAEAADQKGMPRYNRRIWEKAR